MLIKDMKEILLIIAVMAAITSVIVIIRCLKIRK